MRAYLVIANQTLDTVALRGWVVEALVAAPDDCHFHVVVPATRVEHHFTWTEGEARAAARRRLDRLILDLGALGVSVDGEVGDEDPVLAVDDALRESSYDAVVISTLPAGASRWLALDAVGRLRRRVDVPVLHIEAPHPTPVGSSGSTLRQADPLVGAGTRNGAGYIVSTARPQHGRRALGRFSFGVLVVTLLAVLAIRLPESSAGTTPVASDVHQEQAAASTPDLEADPSAPPSPFVDATAPAPLGGTEHSLSLTVEEKEMTVAPGIVQRVMTFNGTVPAPTLRVHVGDTIHVHFSNPATNQMAHSLDFHASENAANGAMRTIPPGQAIDVTWKANFAGVWMYHCVTAPPVFHVGSGMFGLVIVEPKEGLPKVDKEFFVIQNEWYFGQQHQLIDAAKAMASAPAPDLMAFNGIPNQYVDKPLRMNAGDRGRIFVLNVGPNLESSFHIVGMIFDTVIKEGVALLPNNPGHYGSQAVDLAPAQGAMVEFVAPENGMYEFVTHTFNFHDRGAHGMIQVGDGKPPTS